MAISVIGSPSASSTDLGLGVQQQTEAEVEAVRKKRKQMSTEADKIGMTGMPNSAYLSLTGNQF